MTEVMPGEAAPSAPEKPLIKYEYNKGRFTNKNFGEKNEQYYVLYKTRLEMLRPHLEAQAQAKWAGRRLLPSVANVNQTPSRACRSGMWRAKPSD